MTGTMVFDWDGVLHEHADWRPAFGALNFDLIREAQAQGFPVAISTCNDVMRVADALADAGFLAVADKRCEYGQCGWDDLDYILVTNRKVSGYVVDDRAFNYHYGQPTDALWEQVNAAEFAKAQHRSPHSAGTRRKQPEPGHVSRENSRQRKISRSNECDPEQGHKADCAGHCT